MAEIRQIGDILEEILGELRAQNAQQRQIQARLDALEGKDELVSIQEAASLCKVTRQSINNWIRTGRLHKSMHMGKVGILKSELHKVTRI